MARYLVNANSELSAGWYPDEVARVLLTEGAFNGWSEGQAPVEQGDGLDLSLLNDDERKQHDAIKTGHVLTMADLHPELSPQVHPHREVPEAPVVVDVPAPIITADVLPADDPNTGESAVNEGK
jgi:hypothetical protein